MKRGGNLKRTPLKAKSTLSRKSKPKGLKAVQLDGHDLSRVAFPAVCFAQGRKVPCSGKLDLHHCIEKGRLKKAVPEDFGKLGRALRDARNLRVTCRAHHDLIHRSSIRVEEADLPEGFWQFVYDYNLYGWLPRHLAGLNLPAESEAA